VTAGRADHPRAESALVRALGHTGAAIIYQDASSLAVLWARNVPEAWKPQSLIGRTDEAFLPEADLPRIAAAKQKLLDTGESARLEFRRTLGDDSRWYEMWLDCYRPPDGGSAGIITTLVDVTDQKKREQTLRGLLREVSHRSKNLLAIIQSIATQTGRKAGTIEVFQARFRGRLQSLAASQDLVTSSNWRGAMLGDLVAGQVARYADPARAIALKGIDPHLNPNAALHIGLAIHELVVNSVNYGALARPDGSVEIEAHPAVASDGSAGFELVWRERADTSQLDGTRANFGSIALERVVPASVEGEASLTMADGMVEYRLTVPAANFDMDAAP
jgi:two-component sensor histidine kinase